MPAVKKPDTTIRCAVCRGTGKNRYAHRSHHAPCGACFGTGLSTAPYDQRRNGTTVTLWDGEERKLPPDTERHGAGTLTSRRIGMRTQNGMIYLISWPNQDYRGA